MSVASILECENGTYGSMCHEACGECSFNQTCHFVTGICPNGCNPGFYGDLCNERMLKNVLLVIKFYNCWYTQTKYTRIHRDTMAITYIKI